MANERVIAPPVILAGGRVLPSPAQFYLTGEDTLRVVSANAVTGVKLTIALRLANARGEAFPERLEHTPNSDRSTRTEDYDIGIGSLLNITVFASAGTPLIGQTFVIVQLVRGAGAAAIVLGTLLQGYVTATQSVGFPGSPIASSLEGEPVVRTITGSTPALGADISETVPTGARWEMLTAQWKLTTSATAGNRRPSFVMLTSGGTRLFRPVNATNQGPGAVNIEYFAAPTVGYAADANLINVTMPMPLRPILLAGQKWAVQTIGMAVDDQLSAPTYSVREWIDV